MSVVALSVPAATLPALPSNSIAPVDETEVAADAEIFALGQKHDAAIARYRTHYERWKELNKQVEAVRLDFPEVLKFRRSDRALIGRPCEDFVERPGYWHARDTWDVRIRGEEIGTNKGAAKAKRWNEIIEAHKSLRVRADAVRKRLGMERLAKQHERALDEAWKIERNIAQIPANTPAGLREKFRVCLWARNGLMTGHWQDEMDTELAESILEDSYRLCSTPAAFA